MPGYPALHAMTPAEFNLALHCPIASAKDHAEPRQLCEMTSLSKKDERLTITKDDPSSIAMSVRDNPLQDNTTGAFYLLYLC